MPGTFSTTHPKQAGEPVEIVEDFREIKPAELVFMRV
jgi:hypothetical protein